MAPNAKTILVPAEASTPQNLLAAMSLSPNAYKLYLYLCFTGNQILISNTFCDAAKCSRKTYTTSFKELAEQGLIEYNSETDTYTLKEVKNNG